MPDHFARLSSASRAAALDHPTVVSSYPGISPTSPTGRDEAQQHASISVICTPDQLSRIMTAVMSITHSVTVKVENRAREL
jgi:hypothetical protein